MKRLLYSFLILLGLLSPIGLAGSAAAVDVFPVCSGAAKSTDVCGDVNTQAGSKTNPVIGALKVTLNIVSFIVGIAAILMGIIAGFRFITSNGDPAGIKSARDTLLYSFIGITITVSAQAIVVFALNNVK